MPKLAHPGPACLGALHSWTQPDTSSDVQARSLARDKKQTPPHRLPGCPKCRAGMGGLRVQVDHFWRQVDHFWRQGSASPAFISSPDCARDIEGRYLVQEPCAEGTQELGGQGWGEAGTAGHHPGSCPAAALRVLCSLLPRLAAVLWGASLPGLPCLRGGQRQQAWVPGPSHEGDAVACVCCLSARCASVIFPTQVKQLQRQCDWPLSMHMLTLQ